MMCIGIHLVLPIHVQVHGMYCTPDLLQKCDDILVALRYSELHGHLQQCPHHQDVWVIRRGKGNTKVLADLLDTLEQDLKEFLIGNKL